MALGSHRPHGHPEIPPDARRFQTAATLSADHAFVVHFAARRDGGRRRYRGRVEHLVSGRSAAFSSLARLLGFIDTSLGRPSPALATSAAPATNRRERSSA
jgi:hypothetical protein